MSQFQLFESALCERRSYDYTEWFVESVEREMARLLHAYPNERLPVVEKGPIGIRNQSSLTVSHVFVPAVDGVEVVEARFGIVLPDDFRDFYRRWNEGLLLTRNPVKIMSPSDIIQTSEDLRSLQEIPTSLPRHVIRFGDMDDSSFFLLKFIPETCTWEVRFSSYSHATDEQLQDGSAYGTACDVCFTDWLRRMILTDGAPLHPAFPDEEGEYLNKRVE